jgi:hypothetical protein
MYRYSEIIATDQRLVASRLYGMAITRPQVTRHHYTIVALSKPVQPKKTASERLEALTSLTPPEKPVMLAKKTPKEVVDNDDEASDDSNIPPKKPSKKPSKKPYKKPPKKPPKKSAQRIVGPDGDESNDRDGDSDEDRSCQ